MYKIKKNIIEGIIYRNEVKCFDRLLMCLIKENGKKE